MVVSTSPEQMAEEENFETKAIKVDVSNYACIANGFITMSLRDHRSSN